MHLKYSVCVCVCVYIYIYIYIKKHVSSDLLRRSFHLHYEFKAQPHKLFSSFLNLQLCGCSALQMTTTTTIKIQCPPPPDQSASTFLSFFSICHQLQPFGLSLDRIFQSLISHSIISSYRASSFTFDSMNEGSIAET